jgi:UDP-glucose 4-epimerase
VFLTKEAMRQFCWDIFFLRVNYNLKTKLINNYNGKINMRVLVTGGAGYIGSHTCVELLESGHRVFVLDNLYNGHEAALERVRGITNCELQFMNADIHDTYTLDKIFNDFKPEAVIHFAGLNAVGESVADPLMYYDVNVGGSISLLTAMPKAEFNNIVF